MRSRPLGESDINAMNLHNSWHLYLRQCALMLGHNNGACIHTYTHTHTHTHTHRPFQKTLPDFGILKSSSQLPYNNMPNRISSCVPYMIALCTGTEMWVLKISNNILLLRNRAYKLMGTDMRKAVLLMSGKQH